MNNKFRYGFVAVLVAMICLAGLGTEAQHFTIRPGNLGGGYQTTPMALGVGHQTIPMNTGGGGYNSTTTNFGAGSLNSPTTLGGGYQNPAVTVGGGHSGDFRGTGGSGGGGEVVRPPLPGRPVDPGNPRAGRYDSATVTGTRRADMVGLPRGVEHIVLNLAPSLRPTMRDFRTLYRNARQMVWFPRMVYVNASGSPEARLQSLSRVINNIVVVHSMPRNRADSGVIHSRASNRSGRLGWSSLNRWMDEIGQRRNTSVVSLWDTTGAARAELLSNIARSNPNSLVLIVGHIDSASEAVQLPGGTSLRVAEINEHTGPGMRMVVGCHTAACSMPGPHATLATTTAINYPQALSIVDGIIGLRNSDDHVNTGVTLGALIQFATQHQDMDEMVPFVLRHGRRVRHAG